MQHIRNIETDQSKRDARWNDVKTLADCDAYMAIEAQSHARLAGPFLEANTWRGPNWMRGAIAARSERYGYARQIMKITDEDQLYA
ncbi:conserved hypothetical protein [Rhizobium leguminosarum bv. trifolii WSM2304]|uniref:Uncharacterized protein n=1 Tax=Rhizobium leguminosarum bv. trifolii (strain WSM2304) TaxID=395492 RepID=A0ABF7QNK6_RHILW|nr:hypothetical protein [Rhizobium leguminosarum]ACI55735.1 conserved hypothetical protein [Rhizobium leguminosarum bv. trifolii WSM2304]